MLFRSRVIREVLYFTPQGTGTDIGQSLEFLNKVTTRKTVSFIISDFYPPHPPGAYNNRSQKTTGLPVGLHESKKRSAKKASADGGFKTAMAIANRRHDIVAVTLNDPKEIELPDCGLLHLEDAESGTLVLVDSTNDQVRQQYHQEALRRLRDRDLLFRSIGVDQIDISTDLPYANAMVKFFSKRRRRLV